MLDCLHRYGVPQAEWESVITAELLALPGWAGLMHKLETEPKLAPHESVPCLWMDFLAVRLTMIVGATENVRQAYGSVLQFWSNWQQPIVPAPLTEAQQMAQAAKIFDVAQLLGFSAPKINSLPTDKFNLLVTEINAFDDWERRRVWHLAYEYRHEQEILRPLLTHRADVDPRRPAHRPSAQVFFVLMSAKNPFVALSKKLTQVLRHWEPLVSLVSPFTLKDRMTRMAQPFARWW